MGSVAAMVETHSSSDMPSAIIVDIIFEVSVERILALTPLPSPSASTMTDESSSLLHNVHVVAAKLFSVMVYAFVAYVCAQIIHRQSSPLTL